MITRRHLVGFSAASAVAPALTPFAFGQSWPNRYVRLIVPFTPGGANEAYARNLAAKLSEIWGQQVVIENRAGAGGNIGAEIAARSDPDGYTMLIASFPHAVNRYLYPSVGYDLLADFAPITLIGVTPALMVVPNSLPVYSVAEFVAYAKANRGKVTYASSGHGTSIHLSGELFKRMTGIEMTHVPYRGGAPALGDLIPGRVDCMFNVISSVLPQVKAGQMRGLAVTAAKRVPAAPEFPTFAEAGLPGFDVSAWFGFFVPTKTPPDIVAKIHADTVAALADPVLKDRLEQLGVMVVGSTPGELASHIKAELDKWGPVIREAGITIRE